MAQDPFLALPLCALAGQQHAAAISTADHQQTGVQAHARHDGIPGKLGEMPALELLETSSPAVPLPPPLLVNQSSSDATGAKE